MSRALRSLARVAVAITVLGACAVRADAQRLDARGGVSASSVRVARAGNSTDVLNGPVLGAGAGVAFGRFSLEATYLEGNLSPEAGSLTGDEVFADASLIVRALVGGGFSLGAGPHARAFIGTGGTVRWMRIEGRARYAGEVVPGRAHADVEIWQVLSGDVNAQGGSDGGRGGTAGLTVSLPSSRLAIRLAYTADRVAFANGSSEFVDGLEIGLRIGRF